MRLSTLYIDLKKLPVGLTTHTHTETHISTCFQRTRENKSERERKSGSINNLREETRF